MVGRTARFGRPQVILGHVRDKMPRMTLQLSGREGSLSVEFVVDTGFDGQLVLPGRVIRDLIVRQDGEQTAFVPGAGLQLVPGFTTMVQWDGEW